MPPLSLATTARPAPGARVFPPVSLAGRCRRPRRRHHHFQHYVVLTLPAPLPRLAVSPRGPPRPSSCRRNPDQLVGPLLAIVEMLPHERWPRRAFGLARLQFGQCLAKIDAASVRTPYGRRPNPFLRWPSVLGRCSVRSSILARARRHARPLPSTLWLRRLALRVSLALYSLHCLSLASKKIRPIFSHVFCCSAAARLNVKEPFPSTITVFFLFFHPHHPRFRP
jgi:hypothetical protein